MRRREFITLLGGAAASWPLAARAQQSERVRRIGILYGVSGTDLEGQAWDAAFRKRLAELGWIDGRNVHVEYRWTGGNLDRTKLFANELVQPSPDVLVAVTTPATAALQRETRTIPIVFTSVSDPVGSGFVASLRKPGGNITGFIAICAARSSGGRTRSKAARREDTRRNIDRKIYRLSGGRRLSRRQTIARDASRRQTRRRAMHRAWRERPSCWPR